MNEFQPVCLREDPVPIEVHDCKDCGLYKHGTRMVWGEGTPGAPLLVLLDNPGAREEPKETRMCAGHGKHYKKRLIRWGYLWKMCM